MEQPKIPNFSEKLKTAILKRIKEEEHNEDTSYHRPKYFDDAVLNKLIHWMIYEGEKSDLVRDFTDFRYVCITFSEYSQEVVTLYFSGKESEYGAWVFISVHYNYVNPLKSFQRYDISTVYLCELVVNRAPKELYKRSELFKHTETKTICTNDIQIGYGDKFKPPSNMEEYNKLFIGECWIAGYNGKLNKLFKTKLLEFIDNSNNFILQVEDIDVDKEDPSKFDCFFARGIRFYKLPDIDYSSEYALIEKVIAKWELPYCDYEGDMTSSVSFEISPDNYLEIYATESGFKILIFDLILNMGPCSDKLFPINLNICPNFLLFIEKRGDLNNKLVNFAYIRLFEESRFCDH